MSQLRAPAARSERREGGRHGRSGARSASGAGAPNPARQTAPLPTEARIRPQLLRTSVLPAVAVALGGAAAVIFTIRSTGASPTPGLWAVLTGAAALTVASVTAAALGADRAAKSVLDRCNALRRSSARGQSELRTVVEQLRSGEGVPNRSVTPPTAVSGDEFDLLAQELNRSHEAAVAAVVQASRLSSSVGNEQKVEVFVNLARRLQSLVHREIQLLDELENEVEDPELLKGLFHVDHLATRIRRHAENLAVLGGAISRRQWSNPVTMTEVLRSSIAEVEQYPRVKLVPPIDGTLRGHAVADVIHLLAELVENATLFSAPHTTVLLRAQYVTAGLAIEVEDRGLGMPVTEQNKMNALLADPDQVNVAHLLQDGRIGLFVVSALARRHGIAVRLQSNIYGGVQAVLVLPQGLLGADPEGLARSENQAAAVAAGQQAAQARQTQPIQQAQPAHAGQAQPIQAHTGQAQHAQQAQPHGGQVQHAQPHGGQAQHVQRAPQAMPPAVHGGPPAPAPAPVAAPAPVQPPAHTPVQPPVHEPVRTSAHLPAPTPAELPHRPLTYTTSAPAIPLQQAETNERAQPPGRPTLPKRRAQEHLVPQLRDEPVARKPEEHALHDPGLMAAFQRGIGLAESQPSPQEPLRPGDARKE
ncbi:ATP-binding protein [Streptomyces sp. P9(2023)]|uniref:sensor histidine kinase n=1 Tax=Streptomyces sp. P9(2023) TaxID=3064394 RepID=UPI0028F43D7D|nr:ATP-binding protein [Streptomyces sp. P9(2023)]MDT9689988.1 ATP-binding protein [Streptomyces sp. P9(2023)]